MVTSDVLWRFRQRLKHQDRFRVYGLFMRVHNKDKVSSSRPAIDADTEMKILGAAD